MKIFIKLLLTAIIVFALSQLLTGITVSNYVTAICVALTISLLNMFVRPLLVFFTLPATIVTLGLFLFVINACIILLVGKLITGFAVSGFFTALIFSVLLSFFRTLLFSLLKEEKK